MTSLSNLTAPINLLTPSVAKPTVTAPMSGGELAKRAAIHKTATDFEATFLSQMMSPMFEGVSAEAPFGGGEGEDIYKSFLTDAFAKQMAKSGGVGVAASIQREMLKMQGLS
jgi:Rod binding domain-containing protein